MIQQIRITKSLLVTFVTVLLLLSISCAQQAMVPDVEKETTREAAVQTGLTGSAETISYSGAAQEEFSIILIPDTQNYADTNDNRKNLPKTYRKQTEWIRDNAEGENIKFVIHLGDMVQHNRDNEWKIAQDAHNVLDYAQIPYSVCTGNHDYSYFDYPSHKSRYATQLSTYFPPAKFQGKPWFGGTYEEGRIENNYCKFQVGDIKILILTLEFAPRKEVVTWAHKVIRDNQDHRVIVATHSYQDTGGNSAGYSADAHDVEGRDGQDLYRELIKRHSTIFMVVSGHVKGTSRTFRTGNNGNQIVGILTDFQGEKIKGDGVEFGNGWMRKITFKPAQNRVETSVFSAEAGNRAIFKDGITRFYRENSYYANKFGFYYNMKSPVTYRYSVKPEDYLFRDLTAHKNSSGRQTEPAIAADRNGNFVTVWADDTDGNGYYDIFARGFDKDGNQLFGTMKVHERGAGDQRNPAIAMDGWGNFVVAWEDVHQGSTNIRAASFTINGKNRVDDFQVNTVGSGTQRNPSAGMSYYGDFVITWEDDYDNNNSYNICARGFRYNGTGLFNQFRVNPDRRGQQFAPSVAMGSPDGSFVITWEDDKDKNGYYEILARGFNKSGGQTLQTFTVNSNGAGQQRKPSAAMSYYGDFVITWEDDADGNNYYDILARGFNRQGIQTISDFRVNSNRAGQQRVPAIAYGYKLGFAIAWEDGSDSKSFNNIMACFYNADGTRRGKGDVVINSDLSGEQLTPAIAVGNENHYAHVVTAWEDDMNQDKNYDVLVRNLKY